MGGSGSPEIGYSALPVTTLTTPSAIPRCWSSPTGEADFVSHAIGSRLEAGLRDLWAGAHRRRLRGNQFQALRRGKLRAAVPTASTTHVGGGPGKPAEPQRAHRDAGPGCGVPVWRSA